MPRPAVVAFVSNPVTHDARVLREAQSLADAGYEVTIVALWRTGLPEDETRGGVRVIRVRRAGAFLDPATMINATIGPKVPGQRRPPLVRALRWAVLPAWNRFESTVGWLRVSTPWAIASRRWYRNIAAHIPEAHVYHGHDLPGLAMASRVRAMRGAGRVVYDSHEIFMESGRRATLTPPLKALWNWYERRLARQSDAVITVNASVAAELQERLALPTLPLVVMNCPPRWHATSVDPPPRDRLRERLALPPGARILLYQGGLAADRGLDLLPRVLDEPGLESAVLVYLGYGPMKDQLMGIAAHATWRGRVFVLDAVPPDDLLDWTASADVCMMPIQPTTLNHRLATPNKLFESLAAGVPVVASRFPEMERIVSEWRVGELCDPASVSAIAAATARILRLPAGEYAALRRRCRRAALERYNWETEVRPLLDLYERLTGGGAPTSS